LKARIRRSGGSGREKHESIMKTEFFLGLLLCGLAMSLPVREFAAEANETRTASVRASFPTDATKGEVRLVLMSVSQSKVFLNERDLAEKHPVWKAGKQGVPAFTITFLIEASGDGPVRSKVLQRLEILRSGEPVRLLDRGGIYQEWFDYHAFPDFLGFSKPKVTDPTRAFVMRFTRFGAIPDLNSFSLRIHAGFGDNIHEFNFESIELE
jgi:hypothetical protein